MIINHFSKKEKQRTTENISTINQKRFQYKYEVSKLGSCQLQTKQKATHATSYFSSSNWTI